MMKNILITAFSIFFFLFLIWLIRSIQFESGLKKVYENQCLIKNGMKLSKAYKLLDSNVKPQVNIYFNENDTTYSHEIHYPSKWGSESLLMIEYDPFTLEIINYPECN